jgi:hypothetical protein
MTYPLLRFAHLLGAILMGAGLIGVFMADLRLRQIRALPTFAEHVRTIAVFYDGLVVPGALLLLGSGTWMIVTVYGGWAFAQVPWLLGMAILFALEVVEGNTITRLYFLRLRRLTREALAAGGVTPELQRARGEPVPTLTHFLDLPLYTVIVSLGAMRPETWVPFAVGVPLALAVGVALSIALPRLYPWTPEE